MHARRERAVTLPLVLLHLHARYGVAFVHVHDMQATSGSAADGQDAIPPKATNYRTNTGKPQVKRDGR